MARVYGYSTYVAAGVLGLFILSYFTHINVGTQPAGKGAIVRQSSHQPAQCEYKFSRYVPSDWEAEWLKNGQKWKNKICSTMLLRRASSEAWMVAADASYTPSGAAALMSKFNTSILSYFEYSNSCGDGPLRVPIEPLVGLMRHPFVTDDCTAGPGQNPMIKARHGIAGDPEHVQNKGYMVVNPISPSTWSTIYPGRHILVDIGTGRYKSGSIPWFTEIYEEKGATFDDIFGWEIRPVAADLYWAEVPLPLREKMHYYNVPCDIEPDSPFNPLNIIKSIYRPGDFVAIKLDIDNEKIEQGLMKQLEKNPTVMGMIAEMYFEQHFDAPEMLPFFKTSGLSTTLTDVQKLFQRFRSKGLRLHYWP